MVWIPAGTFVMGSDRHYAEEAPAHRRECAGFWMDRAPVTNAQFRRFVKDTGWITLAERPADPSLYPGARPDLLEPASIVFRASDEALDTSDHYRWWQYVPGADWRHPEGPGSSIKARDHHPVVHVAWEDAQAYARWCGKRLPTEVEWERAAWGGREGCDYAWGDELHPGGIPVANTFQGTFPHHNSRLDGHERTSPVGSYPANGFGLIDMIGNVWEWTSSWYGPHPDADVPERHGDHGCCGDAIAVSEDRARDASIDRSSQHGLQPRRVLKGGSFLCAPSYCRRYRPAARMAQGIDTSTCHVGFRCVVRPGEHPSPG